MKTGKEMDLLGLSVKPSFCMGMNPTTYSPFSSVVPDYRCWLWHSPVITTAKEHHIFLYGHISSVWMSAINPLWVHSTPAPSPDLKDPGWGQGNVKNR